ncbi:MAG: hypothetical protein HOV97_24675 [Nonomuraea sp.]|nr:hypothetical protein [Nonomuraea sp.]
MVTIVELVQQDPVSAYTMTSGRLWSLVAAGVGVAGVVAGILGRVRGGRTAAVVALVAGPAAMVIGGIVVAAAKGGPGTGYGIVGGYLDLVVGLAAVVLGGLALSRSRRSKVS